MCLLMSCPGRMLCDNHATWNDLLVSQVWLCFDKVLFVDKLGLFTKCKHLVTRLPYTSGAIPTSQYPVSVFKDHQVVTKMLRWIFMILSGFILFYYADKYKTNWTAIDTLWDGMILLNWHCCQWEIVKKYILISWVFMGQTTEAKASM